MGAFIVYIIKSSLLLAMLVSLFMLFMSRETFHKLNRFLLLLIVVVSLALPFANVGVSTPLQGLFDSIENGFTKIDDALPVADVLLADEQPMMATQPLVATFDAVADVTPVSIEEKGSTAPLWQIVVLVIYVLGVVTLLSLMAYQWIKILRLKSGAEIVKIGNIQIVKTDKPITTFSFFGSIYLPSNISEQDLDIILLHEQSHINHNHSLERIAMELQKALLWWNPSIWYASRLLTEVEEYEADQDVLDSGQDRTNYIQTIFKHLFGYNPEIANGLRNSLTKKRFIMMTTNQKSRYERLRTAALLPIILILVTMFGTTARSSELPSSIEASIADGVSKQINVVGGKSNALMAAMNRVGTRWVGAHKEYLRY